MKINLIKLGLTSESTFEEIQKKLSTLQVYDENELVDAANRAAAGARKAATAKLKEEKNILTDEQLKEYNTLKTNKQMETLKSDKILSKFEELDFNLIVKSEKLLEIEDKKELEDAIKNIGKVYAKKMQNGKPEEITLTEKQKKTQEETPKYVNPHEKPLSQTKQYRAGDLGIFDEVTEEEN